MDGDLGEANKENNEQAIAEKHGEDEGEKETEMAEQMYKLKSEVSDKNDRILELLNSLDDHNVC